MKIVYIGPQSLVEVHGIGVFEQGKAVDIGDDEIAKMLVKQDMFEAVKNIRTKGDEE